MDHKILGKKVFLTKATTLSIGNNHFNLPKNTVFVVEGISDKFIHVDSIYGRFSVTSDLISEKKV